MKTIICSHGFGVRADSYGMLPEIAAAMPDYIFVMFDYNEVRSNGDSVMYSLQEQAKVLQKQIDGVDDGEIELLCHSQGCVIPFYADLSRISKIVMLAPPEWIGSKRIIDRLNSRPGSVTNLDGTSLLKRRNGTMTHITKEYLESIDTTNPMDVYQQMADKIPTVIIRATDDEVIGMTKVNEINNARHIDIAADHNFTGQNRRLLIDQLAVVL